MELEFLLRPITLEPFFREHWDRKPLHVPGPADKFAGVYDAGAWQRLEGLREVKAGTIDQRGGQVEIPIDPRQCHELFLAGMTICADVSAHPTLAPFLAGFRRAFALPGGPAFAKLYASNHGGGFAVHADMHHVFVMQVAGKKLWRFSRVPMVTSPTQGARVDADGRVVWTAPRNGEPAAADDGTPIPAPAVDGFDSALLEPGHCLYLPPGTWHVARAEGHSIAVSVSPPRSTTFELFSRALQDLLLQRPGWRQELLAAPGDEPALGEIPRSAAQALDARLGELRKLLAEIDPRLLYRLWRLNVAVGQAADAPSPPASSVALKRSDVLARAGGQPFHFIVAPSPTGEDEIFFYQGDAEWTFPISARTFLSEMSRQREFRVEAALGWDRSLDLDDVIGILGQLVEVGVLCRL